MLFNEITASPSLLVESTLELAQNALDLDMGRFSAHGGALALLYAARLLPRVHGYLALAASRRAHSSRLPCESNVGHH